MKKPSKLGIRFPEVTWSACKLHFNDPERADYLTFDSLIRNDLSGKWVHLALPVLNRKPKDAMLAGIPRKRPTLEEARETFTSLAATRSRMEASCEEGIPTARLGEFLLDGVWAGGVETADIEKAWGQIQRIIFQVLGTP